MRGLKFDFNNLFDFAVGKEHGVTASELKEFSPAAIRAHRHLEDILRRPESRLGLGLEWTRLASQPEQLIEAIQRLGREISKKYENVIFLGIGGSYLGLKAAQDALLPPYYNDFAKLRRGRPRIYFEGNNLDPDTLSALLPNLAPKKTFVVVISKSGETTETKAAFSIVENWLKKGAGKNYGRQVFAITDPGKGTLRKRVSYEQSKDPLSFRSLPLLPGVGGRFSEFNMGLLHLAITGIDIKEIFRGARVMAGRCSVSEVEKNPAYLYSLLHNILYLKKDKSIAVLMPFSETLRSTADWYVQLLAESLGKKYGRKISKSGAALEIWENDPARVVNVGRTPVASRGTGDLHSIQQNNVEGENSKVLTFIRVEKFRHDITVTGTKDFLTGKKYSRLMGLAEEATEWALVREARPNCAIIMPEVSAYTWGQLLYFFEMATAFEGELLDVNAFDQPGVEGYKNYMYYKLAKPGMPENVIQTIQGSPLVKKARFIL